MKSLDSLLTARLLSNTFIRSVESFAELPSTNDRAIQRAADPAQLVPLLVHAARQSAGRGRGANRWWSSPGALTFSVVVDAAELHLESRHWPLVSLATALTVRHAVAEFAPGVQLGLKWPNDVYACGRKVCGILVETVSGATTRLVIGVGLNVNNSFHDAPPDIRDRAVAIAEVAGENLDPAELLVRLLANLYDQIATIPLDPRRLAQNWREHCLLAGRIVTVESEAGQHTGRCQSIDETGGLVLETPAGLCRLYGGAVTAIS
jgi:BirA family biotin operon repressor/biotin-[acetyl-CoA-carboxylase] ligase